MVQEPYPNPSCFAMERGSGEEKEGKSFPKHSKGAGNRHTDDGGGGSAVLGHGEARARAAEKGENGRTKPLDAGFMRPPRGHRTLLMWHRTRPVTTGLMRREDCKSALHRTMGTGRWL